MPNLTFTYRLETPTRRPLQERREKFLALGRVRIDDGFANTAREDGSTYVTTYATVRARMFYSPDLPYRTSMLNPGDLGHRPFNFLRGRVGVRRPSTRTVITTSSKTVQFLNGRVLLARVSLAGSLTEFGVWSGNQYDPATASYIETATDLTSAGVTQNPTRHHAIFVPHPDTRYLGIGARIYDVPNSGTYRTQYFKKWMLEKTPVGVNAPSAKYGKAREVQVFVKPDRINLATGTSQWTAISGLLTEESFYEARIDNDTTDSTLGLRLNDLAARAGENYWLVSEVYTNHPTILLHAEWDGQPVNGDRVQLAAGRWTPVAYRHLVQQAKTSRFSWVADVGVGGPGGTVTSGFTADTNDVGTYQSAGMNEDSTDPGTYIVSPSFQDSGDPGTYTTVVNSGGVTVWIRNVLVEKSSASKPPAYFNGSTSADTLWEKGGGIGTSRSYLYKNRQARYDAMKRVLDSNVPMGIGVADPVFATYPTDW